MSLAASLRGSAHKTLVEEENEPKKERKRRGGTADEGRRKRKEACELRKKMDGWWMVHFIAPADIV